MKKKILLVVTIATMTLTNLTGCGATEEIAQEAKSQMEWAEENGTLTNAQKPDQKLKDAADEIADAIIDTEEDDETTSVISNTDGSIHQIGDTVPMTAKTDEGSSSFDITITGCEPVYNDIQNCTAVSFTVTCTDGDPFMFENSWFQMYADNSYVESGNCNGHGSFDFANLRPGMSYEGVYVGLTDFNNVSEISMLLGDEEWDIPTNSVTNTTGEVGEPSSEVDSDYLEWAGRYTDGVSTIDIFMYSSPDESSIGHLSGTVDGYGDISCELQYYPEDHMLIGVDCNEAISIYCNTDGDVKSLSMSVTYTGISVNVGPLPMTEHFES